jgi:hypothetical protein
MYCCLFHDRQHMEYIAAVCSTTGKTWNHYCCVRTATSVLQITCIRPCQAIITIFCIGNPTDFAGVCIIIFYFIFRNDIPLHPC